MKIHDLMADLIDSYFEQHLSLSRADAVRLHNEYYTNYGLAIEGLVRHHAIDPLDYNSKVDDALPLERILSPDPALRALLLSLDRTKVKPWLLTNAYITHARRVVRLLGVEDCFEGLTFCDYGGGDDDSKEDGDGEGNGIICKPKPEMFRKAMREAGIFRPQDCYFVDDSYGNCRAAQQEMGWSAVHLVEDGVKTELPAKRACEFQIRRLQELPEIFPQFFKR